MKESLSYLAESLKSECTGCGDNLVDGIDQIINPWPGYRVGQVGR